MTLEKKTAPSETLASEATGTIRGSESFAHDATLALYEQAIARRDGPLPNDMDAYEVVSSLGKGGMGEVFLAIQRSLGREVAVKQSMRDDPRSVAAFLSEARVTARLEHSNIVPVHTLGRGEGGRPLLAMKRVDGGSWAELMAAGETPLEEHLRIFVAVCNAVAFAHEAGFIHRDLKPANVMIGSHGQVFVVDWGIAVGLDRAACDAHAILHAHDARDPAGTPAYMAPELASGDGKKQGPHTDVFLLGACLHEILSGGPPNPGPSFQATLAQAAERPTPTFDESVPRELADICKRALARAPEDRYASVGALREAIDAFTRHAAARAITEKGMLALSTLETATRAWASATVADRPARSRLVHRAYDEARFAFEIALESWPEAPDASAGGRRADRAMLEHALDAEDLPLASRLVEAIADPDLTARFERLRARSAARDAELKALREQARMLDERRASWPVSRVFILAGFAGGAASIPTPWFIRERHVLALWTTWTGLAAATGLFALVTLRGKRSLISPRIGWTWATVGACCVCAGLISSIRGDAPFHNVDYVTLFIAIGFVAQAMQTRRWLVVPGAAMFLGSIVMSLFPSAHVAIFGALWFVTLTGVGVALRRPATADDADPPESRVLSS